MGGEGLVICRWGVIEVGKVGVKGLGPRDRATREGGRFYAKNQSPSRRGSVLANNVRWGLYMRRWGVIKVG